MLGFGRRLFATGELAHAEDVFLLQVDDLRDVVLGGGTRAVDVVRQRRAERDAGLTSGPAPYLGEPPPPVERDQALAKFYGTGRPADAAGLHGDVASPGTAEGTARVVRTPGDFSRERAGDVLVAMTTTPAWTPLFPSLAAVITETGGVLSHGAIVAREYGIPAVVGVPDAVATIPDGARVRVHGDEGRIEIL